MSEDPKKISEEVDISKIEIRSEDVQEILGYIPHWIIRWGITLFFIVIAVLLVGSWYFKYPDVIASSIVATTVNPPASIVARTGGKIQHMFVEDNQLVKKDQYIAIIENSVNHLDLSRLKEKLDAIESFFTDFKGEASADFDPNYSLGELQSSYAGFLKSYADYRNFIKLDYHGKKIASTEEQIKRHELLNTRLSSQLSIMTQELELSKQQFERTQKLYKDGIVSQTAFENAKGMYLQKQYALEGANSSLTNARIQVSQLRQSILDLELKKKEQENTLQLLLKQAYENLNGQVSQWEQRYVLKAPMVGLVSFTRFWSVNQNVKVGDIVFTVIPEGESEIIGKVVLPVQGSGKVKPGQKVNIKFFNYPFVDYGMVRGIVRSKSLVSADNHYHLEVSFPYGLKTNYGKELEFVQEMQGTAEIITEDVRMLERMFKPLKSLIQRHVDEN